MNRQSKSIVNNIFWLTLLIGVGLHALTFNSVTSWILVFFLTSFFAFNLMTLIVPFSLLSNVETSLVLVRPSFDDSIAIKLTSKIKTLTLFPSLVAYVSLDNQVLKSNKNSIFQKDTITLLFHFDKLTRGWYEDCEVTLVCYDFFGLFRKSHTLTLSYPLVILPTSNVESATEVYSSLLDRIAHTYQKTNTRSFDTKRIRPYSQGDNTKLIDWKLTSRSQEIMVRELEDDVIQTTYYILLGLNETHFEEIVSLFYTLVLYYLNSENIVLVSDHQIIQLPTDGDFAKLQPIQRIDALEWVSKLDSSIQKVVFTSKPDQNIVDLINSSPEKGNTLLVYYSDSTTVVFEEG